MRYIIYTIYLIIFTLLWYFLIYSYFENKIIFYKHKLRDLEKLKSKSIDLHYECSDLEKNINNIQNYINKKLVKYKNSNNFSSIIDCIINNNLKLVQFEEEKNIKEKFFYKFYFKTVIEGNFYNIYNFLNCIGNINCFINIINLKINKNKNNLTCNLYIEFIKIIDNII